jgi:hypothetical protein
MGRNVEIELDTSEKPESGPVLYKKPKRGEVTLPEGDAITWTTDNAPYTVVFDFPEGTPFAGHEFPVKKQHAGYSGPVRSDARPGDYRYHIVPGVPSGEPVKPADPKVIIKP